MDITGSSEAATNFGAGCGGGGGMDVSGLSAEESAALSSMRENAELSFAADEMVVRFLRARDLDVSRATEMLMAHQPWREQWKPETITIADLPNSMPSGCWRFAGYDRRGRPVTSIRTSLWDPSQYSLEEYVRYIAFFAERATHLYPPGVSQSVYVFDLRGWKLSHAAYFSYIRQLVELNQTHNPERLGAAFLVNVPFIFAAAWQVIRPWLDKRTASKVVLNPSEAQLHACIDPADLETDFPGGLHEPYPVPNLKGAENVTVPAA